MHKSIANDLIFLRQRLKSGEYDGVDIMLAWMAIDELIELRVQQEKSLAQTNPELDIFCDGQESRTPS